jgi:hypothetical protein
LFEIEPSLNPQVKTMPQATLDQILDQLQMLEPSELQQLSQAVQNCLAARQPKPEQIVFHQALIASGLVRQIKKPSLEQRTYQQLIESQDKPVSETIIEERR